MLRLIRIRNLALIKELDIEFGEGLNLLTGETGSGKSIIVDALGLLLGARSSQEMIRSDCDTAVVEGVFEIEKNGVVSTLASASGFEAEDNALFIRREVSLTGRNRIFINNHLATLSVLKSIGEKMADIHGQQDQRLLLDLSTHLQWLDYFGGNGALLEKARESYKKLKQTASRLDELERNEQERLRRMDVLQFQIDEIGRLDPQPNEKETLENERSILANSERVISLAAEGYDMLYESEASILRGMNRLKKILEELAHFDPAWAAHRETLQEISYKLEDLAYAVRDYGSRNDFSPERLEQVQQRLFVLEKLAQKYGSSTREILQYRDGCSKELEALIACKESSARLSEQLLLDLQDYRQYAEQLSAKRVQDSRRLAKEIRKEFIALAMDRMEMQVQFKAHKETDTGRRIPGFYGMNGIDHIEFLIAPNKGEEMKPLTAIASGGELSRLMLAIRSLCGNEEGDRTFVFDEVDAGIGGRVAEAVGKRLRESSKSNQVLCVTHLPQIAAFARHHFSVHKDVVDGRTITFAKALDNSERIQEISRMLGGKIITETTQRHAMEMLENSSKPGIL